VVFCALFSLFFFSFSILAYWRNAYMDFFPPFSRPGKLVVSHEVHVFAGRTGFCPSIGMFFLLGTPLVEFLFFLKLFTKLLRNQPCTLIGSHLFITIEASFPPNPPAWAFLFRCCFFFILSFCRNRLLVVVHCELPPVLIFFAD